MSERTAGEELAGVGQGPPPQSTEEAVQAELRRREEMSEVELEEAEARDGFASRLYEDDESIPESEVPVVGSPDHESRTDSNAEDSVLEPGESVGVPEDERTSP